MSSSNKTFNLNLLSQITALQNSLQQRSSSLNLVLYRICLYQICSKQPQIYRKYQHKTFSLPLILKSKNKLTLRVMSPLVSKKAKLKIKPMISSLNSFNSQYNRKTSSYMKKTQISSSSHQKRLSSKSSSSNSRNWKSRNSQKSKKRKSSNSSKLV